MANSRIMLTCKHCGEQFCIGKGYLGAYFTRNEKMFEQLNDFYDKHERGECCDNIDCSDDAKNHFVILEEGDELPSDENIKSKAIKEFASEASLYTVQYAYDFVRRFIREKTKLDPVYAFNPTEEELNEHYAEVRDIMGAIAKEMGVEL